MRLAYGLGVWLLGVLSGGAQSVTFSTVVQIPSFSQEDSDVARLVQGANGDFYAPLESSSGFFRVSPSGQYAQIANQEGGYLAQGPDGNFYGSGFRMTPSGNLATLHEFTGGADGLGGSYAPTLGSDGYFYGISVGSSGGGVFYKMSLSGDFQVLHTWTAGDGTALYGSALVEASDGNFYGTASYGGSCAKTSSTEEGCGSVFRLTASGDFSVLHLFTGGADGANPGDLVEASDGKLYGSTDTGGNSSGPPEDGVGTIFSIDLQGTFSTLLARGNGPAPFGPFVVAPAGAMYGLPNFALYGSLAVSKLKTDGEVTPFAFNPGNQYIANGLPALAIGSDGSLYGVAESAGSELLLGAVYRLTFDPALQPPVKIKLGPSQVKPGAAVTASYTVNNAFSLTMQQCYGFQVLNGNVTPLGKAPASYSSSTQLYTGSVAFAAPSMPGNYSYALTCGGVESGYAALQVGFTTATSLTVSPNPVTSPGTEAFTATVTSGVGVPSSGSVTFSADGVTLGTAALSAKGVASITASSSGVAAGSYPVVATYAGSSEYIGSASGAVAVTVK